MLKFALELFLVPSKKFSFDQFLFNRKIMDPKNSICDICKLCFLTRLPLKIIDLLNYCLSYEGKAVRLFWHFKFLGHL